MPKTVAADLSVGNDANQWYGTLVVTNIRYSDGSSVAAREFLGVQFTSPITMSPITVNAQLTPWQPTSSEINSEKIDDRSSKLTVKLVFDSAYIFNPTDTITFGIDGDLTATPDTWTGSFEFRADALPSGVVSGAVDADWDEPVFVRR
ncbi:hypothetical protein OQA88_2562 [Cercophora sp. LCS_1]